MIYFIVCALIVILDQMSKAVVVKNFELGESLDIIKGFFSLTYVENRGAAFGMLQGARVFFIILTVAVFVLAFFYLRKNRPSGVLEKLSISFIAGGALGNFIDRAFLSYVRDFLSADFIDFPVFNIADCFICIGAALYILSVFLHDKKRADYGK